MIIDKQPLPDDPMPVEAPPSYETLGASTSSRNFRLDSKTARLQEPVAGPSNSSPLSPPLSPSPVLKSPALSVSSNSGGSTNNKGKGRAHNWLNFTETPQARTAKEVQKTVIGLIRSVIQEHNHLSTSSAAVGIVQSCAEACASRDVSFSSLLQEKSIENRTPLYWAIVKRLPDEHQEVDEHHGFDLLSALLSHASPLKKETIREVRAACLATSDQTLFQRLRQSPDFAPVSGVNQVLLGVTLWPDEITVKELPGDGGGFEANFVIPQFNKRMTVAKEITLEFIARSRMWSLVFFVASEPRSKLFEPVAGSWCIRLSLIENSPPTYIDSLLSIAPAPPATETASSLQSPAPPSPTRSSGLRIPSTPAQPKGDPGLSIRLKTQDQLQSARPGSPGRYIIHALDTSASGANLQYGANPYIGADEKLRVRFEARLEKPNDGGDCIIC